MRHLTCAVILTTILLTAACSSHPASPDAAQPVTPARSTAIDQGVRAFMQSVAQGVTQNGPSAWRAYFADTPSFFMASEGRLVFPDSAAATTAIHDLASSIKQIELTWGDDLRVDPLAPNLAEVGTTYHEVRVNNTGDRVDETGYFTGTVESQNNKWQLRDAHWSVVPPTTPAPATHASTPKKVRSTHHRAKKHHKPRPE